MGKGARTGQAMHCGVAFLAFRCLGAGCAAYWDDMGGSAASGFVCCAAYKKEGIRLRPDGVKTAVYDVRQSPDGSAPVFGLQQKQYNTLSFDVPEDKKRRNGSFSYPI